MNAREMIEVFTRRHGWVVEREIGFYNDSLDVVYKRGTTQLRVLYRRCTYLVGKPAKTSSLGVCWARVYSHGQEILVFEGQNKKHQIKHWLINQGDHYGLMKEE